MSAPTWATFYKNGKEICRSFMNIGWIENLDAYARELHNELEYPTDEDWDTLDMYGIKLSKDEVFILCAAYKIYKEMMK